MLPDNSELRRPYKYLRRRNGSVARTRGNNFGFEEGLRPKYAYMGVNWYFLQEEADPNDKVDLDALQGQHLVPGALDTLEATLGTRVPLKPPGHRPMVNRSTRRERLMHTARATDELLDTMIQRRLQEEISARASVRADEFDTSIAESKIHSMGDSIRSFDSQCGVEEEASETTAELLGLVPNGSQRNSSIPGSRAQSEMQPPPRHKEGFNLATVHNPVKPDTPVIVWRPSTRVKLATNVPTELLEPATLTPDLISGKRNAVHDLETPMKSPTPLSHLPSEDTEVSGRESLLGRKSELSVREPERVPQLNTLKSKSRMERTRRRPHLRQPLRIPDKPKPEKQRYGAWYVNPKRWTKGMKEFNRGPPESKEERQRNLEMARLDQKISSISQKLPDLFIANEFKTYAVEKGIRIPDYLERNNTKEENGNL